MHFCWNSCVVNTRHGFRNFFKNNIKSRIYQILSFFWWKNFWGWINKKSRILGLFSIGFRPVTISKNRLWGSCFPANFATFLRTTFYRTPLGDGFCTWHASFSSTLHSFDILIKTFIKEIWYHVIQF